MLEYDPRVRPLAERLPDRLPERLRALEPRLPVRRVPRRRDTPVIEVLPVDRADGAERPAELGLPLRAHDRDGPTAGVRDELDRERPEPAGATPDEHDVAGLHGMRCPPEEHPVRGPAGEGGCGRLLPGQVVRLGQALVLLDLGELRHRPPARVVPPHTEGRGQTGVAAGADPRVVQVPLTGMDDDRVPHLDRSHLGTDRVHDPARIGAHDVELRRLAPAGLSLRHVDRDAARRPHVVEVHAGGHRRDQDVAGSELGNVDHLILDRVAGLAGSVRPDEHRVHTRWDLADRRQLADPVDVRDHGTAP